ncbi:hypothetical protein GT347_08855 [Xylophilus rhododendri]|uniref:Uncharacterized protein n=1 Tax=Xylophilus rhododendri TaxID=2697032 RepID=A0A857J4E8_9BURK|nr:hypothetical protein [Xylophilus rhododendri]QHI98093.1 hypothetical protein GT347_08855 [Xylophilus rhododendri]
MHFPAGFITFLQQANAALMGVPWALPDRPSRRSIPVMPADFPAGLAGLQEAGTFQPPTASLSLPGYPDSDRTAMWSQLDPVIRHSPTLRHQLERMRQGGWAVRWSSDEPSLCNVTERVVVLSPDEPLGMIVGKLAHEARHTFQPPITSRQFPDEWTFAKRVRIDEAHAVFNHLWVRDEIRRATGHDIGIGMGHPDYYQLAWELVLLHGDKSRLLHHIDRLYRWETPSANPDDCYWGDARNEWRKDAGLAPVRPRSRVVEAGRQRALRLLEREALEMGLWQGGQAWRAWQTAWQI